MSSRQDSGAKAPMTNDEREWMDVVWEFFAARSIEFFRGWTPPQKSRQSGTTSPQMQRFFRLRTADGCFHFIEWELATLFPGWRGLDLQTIPLQSTIRLPDRVTSATLQLILDYVRLHKAFPLSGIELRNFFKGIMMLDKTTLCKLLKAARSLDLSPLVDLTTCSLLREIEQMMADEVQEIFHLSKDLAESWERQTGLYHPDFKEMEYVGWRKRVISELVDKKRESLEEKWRKDGEGASLVRLCSDVDGDNDYVVLLSAVGGSGLDEDENRRGGSKDGSDKRRTTKKKKRPAKDPNGAERSEASRIRNSESTENTRQSMENMSLENLRCHQEAGVVERNEEVLDGEDGNFDVRLDPENPAIDRIISEFERILAISWPDRKDSPPFYSLDVTQYRLIRATSSTPTSVLYRTEPSNSRNGNTVENDYSARAVQNGIRDEAGQNDDGEVFVQSHARQPVAQHEIGEVVAETGQGAPHINSRSVADQTEDEDVPAQGEDDGEDQFLDLDEEIAVEEEDPIEDRMENDSGEGTFHNCSSGEDDDFVLDSLEDGGIQFSQNAQLRNGSAAFEEANRRKSSSESSSQCNKLGKKFLCSLVIAFVLFVFFLWYF